MSHREHWDYKLALKLPHDGIITTPGDLLEQSCQTTIESLLANGVLLLLQYDFNKYSRARLFKSHLVSEINKITTDKP